MLDIIIWAGMLTIVIGVPAVIITAAWDIAEWIIYGRK